MKQIFKNAGLYGCVAVALTMYGCSKDPIKNLSDDDSRIYITNYDSSASFTSFKTFHVSDSVAVVDDGKLQMKSATEADAAIMQAVKDAMVERGYVLVAKDADPDLGINVSHVINNYSGVVSYPSYWGYYDSYWDPYYWGYGGYDYYFPYAAYAVYEISRGALVVDMVDLKDADQTKQLKGIWNGVARGSGLFEVKNAVSQVQALFSQSPYINANN